MALIETVGTFTLTSNSITIINEWGVRNISLLLVSGTVTYTGTMKLGGTLPNALTLVAGTPLNLTFDFPIDGLIIDASAGVVTIITGK
jgi:hypothetical protein